MPTYEYVCQSCGTHIEVFQRFAEEALTECPTCGGSLRKVFHPAGILFKGSGFYRTDSRKGARTATKAASASGESGDSGSSGSGDAKQTSGSGASDGAGGSGSSGATEGVSGGSKGSGSGTERAAVAGGSKGPAPSKGGSD
jgi:putative FmdB family regulatory protein